MKLNPKKGNVKGRSINLYNRKQERKPKNLKAHFLRRSVKCNAVIASASVNTFVKICHVVLVCL